jgi:metallo-beta-lactamase class B
MMTKRALAALLLWPAAALAQFPREEWNRPAEPFRIMGNLYYVGPAGVSSFLITSPQGHILLDTGLEETVPLIRASVEKLGFKVQDIKIIASSHAHFDHVGGLADMKALTGAQVVASEKDGAIIARGGKDDPALGDSGTFKPAKVDRILRDGDEITVGTAKLTAHLTPGHTPGCTTWTMKVDDGGTPRDVVFHCSTTILPGVSLLKNEKYPEIAKDYERTFEVLRSLPCDVFLGNHGVFFGLEEKSKRLRAGESPNPFIDPKGYRGFVERAQQGFLRQLEEEKGGAPKP